MVRLVPQLSAAVTASQFLPRRAQNEAPDSGAQPHTFGLPPPPHDSGAAHTPQSVVRERPQLSAAVTLPQLAPWRAQNATSVSPVQPQTWAAPPPPQVWGTPHVPQAMVPPQPSLTSPQLAPAVAQVLGVQTAVERPASEMVSSIVFSASDATVSEAPSGPSAAGAE